MTRILLLSSYEPPPDGIAKHSSHLMDAWDSAGHQVLVVSPANDEASTGSSAPGRIRRSRESWGRFPGAAPGKRLSRSIRRWWWCNSPLPHST